MYLRAYFHDRLKLNEVFATSTRVISSSVQIDAIKSGTSVFTLTSVPSAVNEGDVMSVADRYGTMIFQGVILRIMASEIECDQIEGLFNDSWITKRHTNLTLEEDLAQSIRDDFINSSDPIIRDTFKHFQIKVTSQTPGTLPKRDANHVSNFASHIQYVFDNYDIRTDIVIPYDQSTSPTITIGKVVRETVMMGNNTKSVRNVSPITQIYETNKLVVHSEDGDVYRGTFYASNNGITENPNELTRFSTVKTNYAFSDESLALVKAQNLRNEMYNHKIELDLVFGSKLYDFFSFELGQEFEIFINNTYFKTILTGWEYDIEPDTELELIHLIFGKVRLRMSHLL